LEQLQQRRRTKNVITLSVSSAFATHWLIPRFTTFKALHPELELRFQLTGREPGGSLNEADLGIQLDCPDDADVVEHALIPEKIHAVCSPSYASEYGTITSPRRNREITLIRFSRPRVSWRMFFSQTGLARPKSFNELTFSDYSVVVQAALAGQGVALGWSQVTSHAFETGLLQPACREYLVTGDSYKLFAVKGSMDRADVRTVANWLAQEMRPPEIIEGRMRPRE
jgi:DNA-binding transcriptional LysR family regulator